MSSLKSSPGGLVDTQSVAGVYIAAIGVACGGAREASFDHATTLILAFGSSRQFGQDEATDLCSRMRAWADANPGR